MESAQDISLLYQAVKAIVPADTWQELDRRIYYKLARICKTKNCIGKAEELATVLGCVNKFVTSKTHTAIIVRWRELTAIHLKANRMRSLCK